jgi:hypothetical protein
MAKTVVAIQENRAADRSKIKSSVRIEWIGVLHDGKD